MANDGQKIPRIIHQTWKTHDLPPKWAALQPSWKKYHPDWEYRFTTDEDNRKFFAEFYPDFLPIYDGYPLDISRAEAYRYFAMHHYGGVYVDMDFEALRPLDDLLNDHPNVFGIEPKSHIEPETIRTRGLKQLICNAFLASAARHPFWEHMIKLLIAYHNEPMLFDCTGIFLFTRACTSYSDPSHIKLVPSEYLYPIDHHQYFRGITREEILAYVTPQTYAIHHWTGSWWHAALFDSMRRKIARERQKK